MSGGAPNLTKLEWLKRLRGANLTPTEYVVLVTLSTYADGDLTHAHPGWVRLVDDTSLDVRTVKRAVASLTAKGYAVMTRAGGNQYRKGQANEYTLTLPRKGDTQCPPSTPRGTSGAPRGTSGAPEGGHPVHPHQVPTPGPSTIPLADASGTDPAAAGSSDWQTMRDAFDVLEEWLEVECQGLDGAECSTALGMWEGGSHPVAIRNKILADRAPLGRTG